MEFVILGLLSLTPMTGYEIRKFVETNLSMICSASAGSIQTALKKLLSSGNVQFRSLEGSRNRKQYFITLSGKSALEQWLQNPMQTDKNKNMELSKLFFLGFLEKQERIETISEYRMQLACVKANLLAIQKTFETCKPAAGAFQEVFLYQGYTLEYGIAAVEFEEDWYRNLLKKMECEP